MIAMIRKFLELAGERKKQLYLAWLFQALTSICEGAIYFMLFLAIKDILGGSFTKEKLMQYNHTLALDELSEEAASIPAADICMEQAHDRVAEIRRSTQKVTQIRKHLTDTQFRRMWMYFVDGMTIDEIGKVEGVSHQAISLNITAAIRKIKKYF